jgi:hypothetical protein
VRFCRLLGTTAFATGLLLAGPVTSALGDGPTPASPDPSTTPAGRTVPCQADALIAAINQANEAGGGTLNLTPACTYTLTTPQTNQPGSDDGLPPITTPITIHGAGATIARSTAPNTPEFRIFEVDSDGHLELDGVTVGNGVAVGDNVPGDGHSGGDILVGVEGSLSTNATVIVGGRGFVGGVHNYGRADFKNSVISGNTGVWGGGVNNTGGTLNVTNSVVRENKTESDIGLGGGVYNTEGGAATVDNSSFLGNNGHNRGGAIYNDADSVLDVINTRLSHNTAASLLGAPAVVQGGGLYNAGQATIVGTTIDHNRSDRGAPPTVALGAGVSNEQGEVVLRQSQVLDNTAVDAPGGINNTGGTVTLEGTLVARNQPTNCQGSPEPVPGCAN